jgi:predicted transcriptional regulator
MSATPSHLKSLAQAKALASPVRQTVWHLITILAPVSPKSLQEHMGLERHALYYHLRILEECSLVTKAQSENGGVTYITETEDIFLDQQENEEWQAVRRQIAMTGLRRLMGRLDTAMDEEDPKEAPRKYLTGFMTLFLNDQSRQLLRDRLDELWDDLVELQHPPKEGEKPYFLAFGFAPESYGQD